MARDELLRWAEQYNYPALTFSSKPVKLHPVQGLPPAIAPIRYAIGVEGGTDNSILWEVAIAVGKNEMIEALVAHIGEIESELAS